jgi:transposase-like protein
MYKSIPHDIHAKALIEALVLSNLKTIAAKYNISEDSIRRKYKIILIFIPFLVLLTPKKISSAIKFFSSLTSSSPCPSCGSTSISKNGKLTLVNWAKRFFKRIIPSFSNDTESVQRLICNDCGATILSDEHITLKNIRVLVKLFINKFICLLRFKEGLSLRSISRIVGFVFGINASLGYLSKFTNTIGQKAAQKLPKLSSCKAAQKALLAIIDETFPKIYHKSVSLGLVVCEYGLIRAVWCVKRSSSSIKGLLFHSIGKSFKPLYLLGDFHPSYADVAKKLGLVRLTDFVHATRHIYKLVRTHIGKIRLNPNTNQSLNPKERKHLLKLKKKLLRKRIMPIIRTLFKGFKKQYSSIGYLYILGSLENLAQLLIQFPSLEPLYKSIKKFIDKYLQTWCLQMELSSHIPTTSNSIESKNSILKIFSKRIKAFYSKKSLVRFFSAVALWENFDVKDRGPYVGTSPIQRAGIDLNDFGASNFFEAVDLENLSLKSRQIDSNKIIFYLFQQIAAQAV